MWLYLEYRSKLGELVKIYSLVLFILVDDQVRFSLLLRNGNRYDLGLEDSVTDSLCTSFVAAYPILVLLLSRNAELFRRVFSTVLSELQKRTLLLSIISICIGPSPYSHVELIVNVGQAIKDNAVLQKKISFQSYFIYQIQYNK